MTQFNLHNPPFIQPTSSGVLNSYTVLEFDPLLDSSSMQPKDWAMIAGTIEKHYYDYDGFVVIHGTDTMAYVE